MKTKIGRYILNDVVDLLLLILSIILLIRAIRDNWFETDIYGVAGILFGILYISGVIFRMANSKAIMNEYIEDTDVRRSLGMGFWLNRYDKVHQSTYSIIVKWGFVILATVVMALGLLIY